MNAFIIGQTTADDGLYGHSHLKGSERDMFHRMYAKWLKLVDRMLYAIEGDEI